MEEDYEQNMEIQHQIKEFHQWLSELSIVNFSDYESVWTKPHKFRGLYRVCCYKYYRGEALCDIYRSRLTTKQISAAYLHQFIEGMLQPKEFYRFKWYINISCFGIHSSDMDAKILNIIWTSPTTSPSKVCSGDIKDNTPLFSEELSLLSS